MHSPKPRLLIPITVQFSVRYLLRTGLLTKMCDYVNPILILGWQDAGLENELRELGIEFHLLPPKKIGSKYERILKQLTGWHLRRINTPTTAIDKRRTQLLTPPHLSLRIKLRDGLFQLLTSFPPYVQFLLKRQRKLLSQETNLAEYVALVKSVYPDLAFCLTPYFVEEELLLRAVESNHIPISTAILSFDNLTTRGFLPISFSEYYLWNQHNLAELRRIYPESVKKTIEVVGAPQFDFYYDPSYIWSERDWRNELHLPAKRPVILFGSASKAIAPQEEQWLMHLDIAIEEGHIFHKPLILFRRHPNEEMGRWELLKGTLKHTVFDEPWPAGKQKTGKTNVTHRDIEKLASTLFHSRVHINASSTMTVDGAIFDRPQIGPAYDEEGTLHRIADEIYLREHYLPITRSGGLQIVHSRQELIWEVNQAFQAPERFSEGRKALVQEICSFADGKSTERVNRALRAFVDKNRPL
jgi:CDP-glycerol glycerophosphotransferase (TagB/SpsB family)